MPSIPIITAWRARRAREREEWEAVGAQLSAAAKPLTDKAQLTYMPARPESPERQRHRFDVQYSIVALRASREASRALARATWALVAATAVLAAATIVLAVRA